MIRFVVNGMLSEGQFMSKISENVKLNLTILERVVKEMKNTPINYIDKTGKKGVANIQGFSYACKGYATGSIEFKNIEYVNCPLDTDMGPVNVYIPEVVFAQLQTREARKKFSVQYVFKQFASFGISAEYELQIQTAGQTVLREV